MKGIQDWLIQMEILKLWKQETVIMAWNNDPKVHLGVNWFREMK